MSGDIIFLTREYVAIKTDKGQVRLASLIDQKEDRFLILTPLGAELFTEEMDKTATCRRQYRVNLLNAMCDGYFKDGLGQKISQANLDTVGVDITV